MDISEIQGLSEKDVAEKRKQFGYNELPDREKKSAFGIIFGIITEPMIFLLIAVVVVYFLLGDRSEAIILMVSVFVIITINLFQDLKTEKALEALRNLSSPSCEVIRDWQHKTIPSRELVPGDMVLVSEGGRVPADGKLVSAGNLAVDESLLTGESVPVDKQVFTTDDDKTGYAYSSSMVVKGHGILEVSAIGVRTEVGKIGDSLNKIKPEKTLIKKEVDTVVRIIAVVAISAALLLTLVFWLARGDLLNGFLAGLTLSIALLPEEFPVVLTVFMALGAWRLAKSNVLTRKSSSIETLGSASVLCTDKTGTLTQNQMTIVEVSDVSGELLEKTHKHYDHVVSFGVLASQVRPFDPMEEAFIKKAQELMGSVDGIYNGYKIVKEYPLEDGSRSVVHVWGGADKKPVTVALKGAPEDVFKLCRLPKDVAAKLEAHVEKLARDGLRVLAVAKGAAKDTIPETRDGFEYEFLGLVALADPIRPEAASAVKMCRDAGIRVIMITGDYPETAKRIGGEVGLDNGEVITGEEFSKLSPEEQDKVIRRVSIFSRVVPSHKLAIVESLKRDGEVVAMTGDGVNDAPALKSAHIGIAMGNRGTDVAREASSIVLLDDNFASIVRGIRLGRRIFTNLSKAMAYVLMVHMPIIVLSLLPVLLGWPLVLLPIHIVFLEFIIDPSCTLIFEGEEEAPDTMKRPPRRLSSPLFSKRMVLSSVFEGSVMALVALSVHYMTMQAGWSENKTRALTFLVIVLMNLAVIVVLSGRRALADALKKRGANMLFIILGIAAAALAVVYFVTPARELFKFEALSLFEMSAGALIAAVTALLLVPIRKLMQ